MQDKYLVENYNVRLEIFFAAPNIFPLRRFEGQQSVKPTKWLFEVEELVRSISFPPNLLWVPTILSSSAFQNFEKSLVTYDLPHFLKIWLVSQNIEHVDYEFYVLLYILTNMKTCGKVANTKSWIVMFSKKTPVYSGHWTIGILQNRVRILLKRALLLQNRAGILQNWVGI